MTSLRPLFIAALLLLAIPAAQGAWYQMRPDPDFVMDGSADTLWTRLIARMRAVVVLAQ